MEKSNCSNCLRESIMDHRKLVYSEDNNEVSIKDENENTIKSINVETYHNKNFIIPSNDYINYCPKCDNFSGYPHSYDNEEKTFKTRNNNRINFYDNYLEDNIIHNFDNVQCKICSQNLLKGFYSHEIITEKDIIDYNLSIPTDVLKPIKIYSQDLNGLENKEDYYRKSIICGIFEDNFKTHKMTSYNGRSILYCPECSFGILNSLETVQ